MTFEEANRIPLEDLLMKMGFKPSDILASDLWYLSPLRDEKTPSFHVNVGKNVWYDFGAARGGSALDLVCAYLESRGEDHTLQDALRWILNMCPAPQIPLFERKLAIDKCAGLNVLENKALNDISLIRYLEERGIPEKLAKRHLRQLKLHNNKSGKNFLALGLKNVNDGFELKNKIFKGSIGSKSLSLIRGPSLPRAVHIFEGMMDFLSAVQLHDSWQFEGDVIVLNSLSCLPQLMPYIQNYSYGDVYAWLDNDAAGTKAALMLQEAISHDESLTLRLMNNFYAPHKDVNEWHLKKKSKK